MAWQRIVAAYAAGIGASIVLSLKMSERPTHPENWVAAYAASSQPQPLPSAYAAERPEQLRYTFDATKVHISTDCTPLALDSDTASWVRDNVASPRTLTHSLALGLLGALHGLSKYDAKRCWTRRVCTC